MINITFSEDKEAGSLILTMDGHAGAAPEGSDIVCSAASILGSTLAQTLTFMYDHGRLKKKPHISMEKGKLKIIAKPKDEARQQTRLVYWYTEVGMLLLAANYKDFISLKPFDPAELKRVEPVNK